MEAFIQYVIGLALIVILAVAIYKMVRSFIDDHSIKDIIKSLIWICVVLGTIQGGIAEMFVDTGAAFVQPAGDLTKLIVSLITDGVHSAMNGM